MSLDVSDFYTFIIGHRLDETGDVPEFVTEVAAGDDGLFGEGLVHAGGATPEDAETEGVGAIFGNEIHRIDDVAFTLAHLLAVGVEDETVEVDLLKRNFARNVKPHHNHTGNPGKEDVGASFHDVERIIRVEILCSPVSADDGPVTA